MDGHVTVLKPYASNLGQICLQLFFRAKIQLKNNLNEYYWDIIS